MRREADIIQPRRLVLLGTVVLQRDRSLDRVVLREHR
ncbi:hypothetical protein AWB69_07215 [Caballeronia udeis]|uniref:Uncharacterized protein n=1 Tax=Caballeronia udeis TaxID=1232866 RepID=A0A158J5M6_9BURK|nr:hypothetical protein AWB69_07215 [Caballeronia udeis]